MAARMRNPAVLVPDALPALHALTTAVEQTGLPTTTIGLVHLRASQINGCSVCVDAHPRQLKQAGETDERIHALAAWRDTPYYTDAERAALALTEAITRLHDPLDPVPDPIWDEAAKHYTDLQLAALILAIATINVWNRLNIATKQQAGQRWR